MMIQLLKLVEFGEGDKEERREHDKETTVLVYCAYPETNALRADEIIVI